MWRHSFRGLIFMRLFSVWFCLLIFFFSCSLICLLRVYEDALFQEKPAEMTSSIVYKGEKNSILLFNTSNNFREKGTWGYVIQKVNKLSFGADIWNICPRRTCIIECKIIERKNINLSLLKIYLWNFSLQFICPKEFKTTFKWAPRWNNKYK